MTLRKKDLEAEVRAEPRQLPRKESDTETAPDQHRSNTGPVSKRPRKILNVRLDPEDLAELELEAGRTGISMAGIIRSLVREHLRRREGRW